MSVYFVRAGESGPVKIGTAVDVESRIAEFQCGHFSTLKVIRVISGGRRHEGWLHRHFRALRLRGEWFTYSDEMLTVEPTPDVLPFIPREKPPSQGFRALMDLWPSRQAFAEDHDISVSLANVWHFRDSIPPDRWEMTVIGAKKRRISGVTHKLLTGLRSRKRRAA